MKTYQLPFTIHIPATADKSAIPVETIMVDVYDGLDGEPILTTESTIRIGRTQAYHMGLMTGADIKTLRKKFKLTQAELADYLKCGKKSISRWENGKGHPSGLVNKLLRLLDEGYLTLADLSAVEGPRTQSPLSPQVRNKLEKLSSTTTESFDYSDEDNIIQFTAA